MKKVLCFAAAALTLFAACQKTTVVYDNNTPQEISFFAVNKVATKAPVEGTAFRTDDNMRVSAYLAEVTGSDAVNYFENILFEGNDATPEKWVGGQYWPLSDATMNFIAVTETGGGVDASTEDIAFAYTAATADPAVPAKGTYTVKVTDNQAFNQSDVMYAACSATKTGNTAQDVPLVFNHALAWVNFQFNTNVDANIIKINSVTLHAKYNGTLTVADANYDRTSGEAALTAVWDNAIVDNTNIVDQLVPNADRNDAAGELVLDKAAPKAYGAGLLVVPTTDEDYNNHFVINYSIMQTDANGTASYKDYSYKHTLNADWAMGKKYTYNITINMHEIQVAPTVTNWDPQTADNVNLGA